MRFSADYLQPNGRRRSILFDAADWKDARGVAKGLGLYSLGPVVEEGERDFLPDTPEQWGG